MSNESAREVTIQFDEKVCRLTAIKKAAYRFGGRCFVRIELRDGGRADVTLTPKRPEMELPVIAGEFRNEVLDQELRELVAEETLGVRNLLLAQAFSATSLVDADGETGDPSHDPLAIGIADRDRQG